MFFHNWKYALKTLFKNKTLLFWTFAFPLILGTLFQMAFSNIEHEEQLDQIPIAVVDHPTFTEALKSTNLFKIFDVSLEEAKRQLEEDQIEGYLVGSDSYKIVVKKNGINQTILKQVTDQILQTSFPVSSLVEIEDISSSHLGYTIIEFYTLIAMTCLYGGILGLYVINQNLANQSHNGKRIAVSPNSKEILILSSALAGFIVQLIGMALLFLYTIFILHINYGEHIFLIILLSLVGCFAGLCMGILIASVFKVRENTKIGLVISFTMFGCFLSGMMGITMKYVIDKNVKFLNLINPASMITDGLYALYYYDTLNRYFFNLISLLLFSIVMLLISMKSLRRQSYDSI